jgi:hypothetical protein
MPDRFFYPSWYSEAEQQAIADRAAADLAEADQAHAAHADRQAQFNEITAGLDLDGPDPEAEPG